METITVSEFEKRIKEIEILQSKVDNILNSYWLFRWLNFSKAIKYHYFAESKMRELFSVNLISD